MSALGYIDEVIGEIFAKRKIYHLIGKKVEHSCQWMKVDPSIAYDLVRADKYSLPPLGQFYRPVEDLYANKYGKYSQYMTDYEFEMLKYPPAEEFVLEFRGMGEQGVQVRPASDDVEYTKYVMLCKQIPNGISFEAFYYNVQPYYDIPVGWHTSGQKVELHYSPPEERITPNCKIGNALRAFVPDMWGEDKEDARHRASVFLTGMVPEFRALAQFLVVTRVRKGVTHEYHKSRVKCDARNGRNIGGYRYHILDIHSDYVENEERHHITGERILTATGRASPGRHWRRAHLRWFQDDTFTFIRRMRVGRIENGIIEKDYRVK